MSVKQISAFVENKSGKLAWITGLLAESNIDIKALSIADTTDYGILRLIVNDTDKAVSVLKNANILVSETEVLAVELDDTPGGFSNAIGVLSKEDIGVEYAYAFITSKIGKAYVVLRVEDNSQAEKILKKSGYTLFTHEDLF